MIARKNQNATKSHVAKSTTGQRIYKCCHQRLRFGTDPKKNVVSVAQPSCPPLSHLYSQLKPPNDRTQRDVHPHEERDKEAKKKRNNDSVRVRRNRHLFFLTTKPIPRLSPPYTILVRGRKAAYLRQQHVSQPQRPLVLARFGTLLAQLSPPSCFTK